MFSNSNPFADFFKAFPQTFQDNMKNMQNMMGGMADTMKANASGPFGIPTVNGATPVQDKEFTWAFDPQFNMLKGVDLSNIKSLFPGDFMKQWQDAAQNMTQNMGAPFTATNLTDLTSLSKVSGVDWQALMNAQKKNMEAFTAAHHAMVSNCQQFGKRQGEIIRETMQTAAQLMTDMMATGTPEEKLGRQVDIAKQSFDIMSKHVRELSELCAQSQTEALDTVSDRVRESLDELKKSAQTAEDNFHAASQKADAAAKKAAAQSTGGDTLN